MTTTRKPRTPAQEAHAKRWSAGVTKALPPSGPMPPKYERYRGTELQPFTGRAGALDALRVPSLIQDERRRHFTAKAD